MCCGYRVLLSSPSLLDIDFTVFVRFIPFYFHQGKLGCQDLLTRNKPLSLSWLQPSRAGCKRLPGCVWQGRRLLALHTAHSQPACPTQGAAASTADQPAEDKARNLCLKWHMSPFSTGTQGPAIVPHSSDNPIEKASFFSHVPVTEQETPRAGVDQSACIAQDNTGIHAQM